MVISPNNTELRPFSKNEEILNCQKMFHENATKKETFDLNVPLNIRKVK